MSTAIHTKAQPPASAKQGHTPMMVQYLKCRAEVPTENAVLFFRMGDFYEVFFDDAELVAKTLDIALTRRGKFEGKPIPMSGVPVHSAKAYIHRLQRAGVTVAIAEQMEDRDAARQRGRHSVVAREIVATYPAEDTTAEAQPRPLTPYRAALQERQRADAAGETVQLDERLATFAYIEEVRHLWDEDARLFEVEHEGVTYECAAYTMGHGERTEFEFHTFAETEEGVVATESPADLRGCGRAEVRLSPGADIEAIGAKLLADLVDRMRYTRERETSNVITPEDIRTHFVEMLASPVSAGETWQDYRDKGGITDAELSELLARKLGTSSGSGAFERPGYRHEGAGHRVWLAWHGSFYGAKLTPTIAGAKALAMARDVLNRDYNVPNPDDGQLGLF